MSVPTLILTQSDFNVNVVKQKRSTANLEYVMKILEEQGRLHEVDGELLKRIQATINKDKPNQGFPRKGKNFESSDDKVSSILQRARLRQQQLFGVRSKDSFQSKALRGQSREQDTSECADLKKENARLKKKLLAVTVEQGSNRRNLLLQSLEDTTYDVAPVEPKVNPLDKLLLASTKRNEPKIIVDPFSPQVSSILITPTPTMTTIIDTTSFITTTTLTVSKEIGIYYHGKRIPTHIVDTEVEVQTVTSTMSTTMQITPTPTWKTITITPTVTTPSSTPKIPLIPTEQDAQKQNTDSNESLQKFNQLKSSDGIKAEVIEIPKTLENLESLRNYLQHIKQLKAEQSSPNVAEPLVSPSTTISTVFMSGSVPGQFSTSLVTLTLSDESYRRKREIKPSHVQPLLLTKVVETEKHKNVDEISIFGSFNDEIFNKHQDSCSNKIETVTVTVTKVYQP